MRHFDTRKDGQVSYNEFCDALPLVHSLISLGLALELARLDPDWTTVMLHTKHPLDESRLAGGLCVSRSVRISCRCATALDA